MKAPQTTVYFVDDEPDVTRALIYLLDSIQVRACAFSSAREFFDHLDLSAGPACLVLDLRMPDIGGLEVMKILKDSQCNLPVIFLSAHGDIPAAVQAMQLGAIDFLQKPFNPQFFLDAINRATRFARESYETRQSKMTTEKLLDRLSPREREVLEHLLRGATSKEIARSLDISYKTVDVHRSSVLRKIGVCSCLDLKRKLDQSRFVSAVEGSDFQIVGRDRSASAWS